MLELVDPRLQLGGHLIHKVDFRGEIIILPEGDSNAQVAVAHAWEDMPESIQWSRYDGAFFPSENGIIQGIHVFFTDFEGRNKGNCCSSERAVAGVQQTDTTRIVENDGSGTQFVLKPGQEMMRHLFRFVFMHEMACVGHRDDRWSTHKRTQAVEIVSNERLILQSPDDQGWDTDLRIPQLALAHAASTSESGSVVIDHGRQRAALARLLPVELHDIARHMCAIRRHALKDPSNDVAMTNRQGSFRKPGNLEDAHIPRSA